MNSSPAGESTTAQHGTREAAQMGNLGLGIRDGVVAPVPHGSRGMAGFGEWNGQLLNDSIQDNGQAPE